VDESFYIDAKTYPVTAVSQQFYNQWHSAPLQEYVSKSDVMKRLFPRLYPGEQNRFKGVVLERDIVTRRGNQRGLLRGGFLGEMAFRYLDAKSQKNGENGIDYIFIVLNGSNPEMADLYNRYTEAKKKLDSNHPSQLVKAVEGIIPYQTWGAKFKTEVQEVPAEIYKDLVLISAIRDRS
jgi:hypothetical protein